MTLTFDLWPWTLAAYRLWRDETLYQIWTQSSNLRRSYCNLNIWPNDLEHRVTCCARFWDNFHQVWPSTTYPAWTKAFLTLIRNVMLGPLPLTRWSWKFVVHQLLRDQSLPNLSEAEQSPAELLLIILRIFAHVMSRHDLDFWPLDLEHLQRFGCHAFQLSTKFERNRIIHSWVIDNLVRFRRTISGSGALLSSGSQGSVDPTSRYKIGCQLVLITDGKSHTGFRLIPISMTLNDLERRNSPYFAFFHRIRLLCWPITSLWLKVDQ